MQTEEIQENYNLPEPYVFEAKIGEGGGGIILKAYDKELRKYVVLKQIKDSIKGENRRIEVDILKNLNHRYIPAVHGFKTIDGNNYTVMDFVDGKSVGTLLKEGHKFREKEIIKYAEQLCEALDYLHTRRVPVLHGDIKPDNIMIREDGDACLIDFNISGNVENGKGYTTGLSKNYAAPEQIKEFIRLKEQYLQRKLSAQIDDDATVTEVDDDATVTESGTAPQKADNSLKIPIDACSDIYSLGATLFHMCAGVRVDQFDRKHQTLDISEGLLLVLNRSLEEDPKKRFQSAAEMLKAVRNIFKGDKRYKAMVFRQNLARILFFIVGIAGVLLIEQGYTTKLKEADKTYEKYIEIMRTTDDDTEFEDAYQKAIAQKPDDIDPYIQYEYRLFIRNAYADCADYVETTIMPNPYLHTQDGMEDVYYVLGNCYLETKDYKAAVNALRQSLNIDNSNAGAYVDLAVAYANNGDLSDAQNALDKAISLGINNESLNYASGEIALSAKEYDKAISYFTDCIAQSSDDYRKMRAYVLIDEAYVQKGITIENVDARIEALTKAKTEVSMENRFLILNSLAQAYIDGSALQAGAGYEQGAIDASNELIAMGLGNVNIYSNVVILKQRVSDYAGALETVKQMEDKFPDSYITMKRRAFLEAEMQGTYAEAKRDYSTFLTYYKKATELYEGQKNRSDAEMLLLDQTYQKLADGNWLD